MQDGHVVVWHDEEITAAKCQDTHPAVSPASHFSSGNVLTGELRQSSSPMIPTSLMWGSTSQTLRSRSFARSTVAPSVSTATVSLFSMDLRRVQTC